MSLTRFVRRPEVAARLAAFHPFPPPELPRLLVPPGAARADWIGMAFDYLLRFELQRQAPHASAPPWRAELALADLIKLADADPFDPLPFLPPDTGGRSYRELADHAAAVVNAARTAVALHAASPSPRGQDREALAGHAFRLAMLDTYYREGHARDVWAEPTPAAVRELLDLLDAVPFDRLVRPGAMVLNPDFGPAAALVGAADGDLISGGLLVEFKVVRNARHFPEHLNQLLGYLLLAREHQRRDAAAPGVSHVGIYFARHGHPWVEDAAAWTGRPGFAELEQWFFDAAGKLWPEAAAARGPVAFGGAKPPAPSAGKPRATAKPKGAEAKETTKPTGKAAAKAKASGKRKAGGDGAVEPPAKGGRAKKGPEWSETAAAEIDRNAERKRPPGAGRRS